jgi:hypothetical protein
MTSNILKILKKYALFAGLGVVLGIGSILLFNTLKTANLASEEQPIEILGGSGDDRASWVKFDSFDGYQTKADPQKITKGANPSGQNTYINDGDRISIRDLGYEIFPSGVATSTEEPIISLYTFRKRDGTNILLRSYDDELEYYYDDIGVWERLNNGYTADQKFGFVDHNTNIDQTSYVYFCNAVENYSRWTGNVSVLSADVAVGTTTLNVDSTLLFPSSGTLILCGETTTFSAKTDTTFTVPTTTITCDSGRGVAQTVQEYASAPKGNILALSNTRVYVAGVASSTQTLFYTKIADATDFTLSAPRVANDGGTINMPEGGGGIVGMAIDEEVLYVFKRNIIKAVTFSQDGNDLPVIKPLKPFDNKSQTVGALNAESIFAGGNGIFFITPNNEIMNLARVEGIDYPQVRAISDIIKPTVEDMIFDESVGVYWKNKAYFSAKATSDSNSKDILLVYNSTKNAWESPVVGFNVNAFTIAKFTGNDELYFGSSASQNVYKINDVPLDDIYGLTANWRSREETFGVPHVLKSVDNFYVEGYITDNTTLSISLLLDEDGYTQIYTTDFVGNEDSDHYRYISSLYNLFGLHPFGYERFGSNDNFTGKKKFRIYLGKNLRRIPFNSIQVEFASDGENDQWEILQYAYHVMMEPQEINSKYLRAF